MFKRERESSSGEGTLLLKKVSARFLIVMCEVDLKTSTQATLIETSTVHVTTSKIEWKKISCLCDELWNHYSINHMDSITSHPTIA